MVILEEICLVLILLMQESTEFPPIQGQQEMFWLSCKGRQYITSNSCNTNTIIIEPNICKHQPTNICLHKMCLFNVSYPFPFKN